MIVVAIDPGIDGAAAALDDSCGLFQDVIDLPTRIVGKRREIDVRCLSSWMYHLMPRRIVIEEVHSMPRDGRVGSFNFGVTYGMLKAVSLLATNEPPEFVAPQRWKSYFRLISEDKAASRGLALRLWPFTVFEIINCIEATPHLASSMSFVFYQVHTNHLLLRVCVINMF